MHTQETDLAKPVAAWLVFSLAKHAQNASRLGVSPEHASATPLTGRVLAAGTAFQECKQTGAQQQPTLELGWETNASGKAGMA